MTKKYIEQRVKVKEFVKVQRNKLWKTLNTQLKTIAKERKNYSTEFQNHYEDVNKITTYPSNLKKEIEDDIMIR